METGGLKGLHAGRYARRQAIAVAFDIAIDAFEAVGVITQPANDLEPVGEFELVLDEATPHFAIAGRIIDKGAAEWILDIHIILEPVAAIGHRVAESARFETRRVVDVEACRDQVETALRSGGNRNEAAIFLIPAHAIRKCRLIHARIVHIGAQREIDPIIARRIAILAGEDVFPEIGFLGDRARLPPIIVMTHPAERDLMTVGGADDALGEAALNFVIRVLDLVAVAAFVVVALAIGEVAEKIECLDRLDGARHAGQKAIAIGLIAALDRAAILLALAQEVARRLGLEDDHAANGARAINIGDGPAHHRDLLQKLGLDPHRAGAAVIGTGEIVAGAIGDHGDAAEILEAADIDAGAET